MHKVYLLIRRNKQTGPYTLEELVQLGLQPLDLVWVEGKSAAWSYPSEISSLQPYLKKEEPLAQKKEEPVAPAVQPDSELPEAQRESESLKTGNEMAASSGQSSHEAFKPSKADKVSPARAPSPRLVYISHPKNKSPEPAKVKEETPKVNIEQKAEELRKRIENYVPEKKSAAAPETIQTKYAKPLNEVEEDFATWTYNKKAKKQVQIPLKPIMSVALGVLLIAGTYGLAKYAFSTSKAPASKDTVIDNRQDPQLTTEKLILETPPAKTAVVEKLPTRPVTENKALPKVVAEEKAPPAAKREEPVAANDRKPQKRNPEVVVAKKNPPVTEPQPKQKTSTVAVPAKKDEKAVTEPVATNTNKSTPAPPPTRDEPVVAATPAKKKSFDERVDEFINQFKRKKTGETAPPEPVVEETQPQVPNTGTAERKARRRDEEPVAAAPEPQNLEEFVEVSSSQPPENWMLGIHNLKLTVSNRSTVPVKKAAVEIRYLNNLNEVIEKKVLNVTNIPAKKSVLVLAPDHRLAERLESRVLSAEGN